MTSPRKDVREKGRPAPLVVQVSDTAAWFRQNPRGFGLVIVIVIAALSLSTSRPKEVRLEALEVGDCLFIRTPATTSLTLQAPAIGSLEEVRLTAASGGGERTPCNGSHGHEVSAVVPLSVTFFDDFEGAATDAYPGEDPLLELAAPACPAAFGAFVGHPLEGSTYDTAAVVPSRSGWGAGDRQAVCLVFGRDGRFLDHQARHSGA